MSGLIEKKWYVIKTVTGQENKIKNYIENETSRLGYADYVEEVLVPTEKVVQVRNGKKITKDRVHMPGYVMVKVHLASIGSGIRARCPTNRTLVNINQSIHMLNAADFLELTWLGRIAVEFLGDGLFKDKIS